LTLGASFLQNTARTISVNDWFAFSNWSRMTAVRFKQRSSEWVLETFGWIPASVGFLFETVRKKIVVELSFFSWQRKNSGQSQSRHPILPVIETSRDFQSPA